jgi:1-acyl-sn-glycerol-3-phosphate acyltransferase
MTFWYLLGYSLSRGIAKTLFRYRVIGAENIIEEGPAVFAANHASFLDPPLAGIASRRGVHYLARKTLLDWPILGPILPELNVIPVDQENADRSALMASIRVVRQGGAIVVFPEGSRTLDGNLQPAQPGVGLIVAKTGAPVVPMRLFGSFEAFPRGRAKLRLVPITVVVGKPLFFTSEETSGRDAYQKTSDRIMDAVAALEIPEKSA